MANFKIVLSDPKSRKAYQKEVEQGYSGILGKKIGEQVSGNTLGLPGYELELTGGSDADGFPMRRDVNGSSRKKIILSSGPGFHPSKSGHRKRKSIRGNTYSEAITQVNTKVLKYGEKTVDELFGVKKEDKPAEKKEEAKTEAPKEEVKQEQKTEEKPAEKKEEPKAEAKEDQAQKAEEKMGVKKLE